jgi:hypothetical protein
VKTIAPRVLGTAALLALAGACRSYPQKAAAALSAFEGGDFERARALFADEEEFDSPFLSGAEAGTAALANGDWPRALEHFQRAAASVQELEDRAPVGLEALGETFGSWALNDTLRNYEGEGFERVYVHCGLALAYLAQGKVEDVYVEGRLSNRLLESEEKLYEKSYQAGGLGHLLSALAYELLGDLDDAYIDLQRMEEKEVGSAYAWPELVRLAARLGRMEDRARLEEKHGLAAPPPGSFASVVVLAGVGLGPFKQGGQIPIPTPDGLITVSAATFQARPQLVSGLRLCDEGGPSRDTVLIESVADVARENLQDRLAWQVAKSIARGVLKRELTKKLQKKWDAGGRVLGDVLSLVTEVPDLRAWLTLPDSWHAARLFVPPGQHRFRLEAIGGEAEDLGAFELDPGEVMFVFARTLGTRLYVHTIGGSPVDEAGAAGASQATQGSTP